MDDSKLIELYFSRNESAIIYTQNKYGGYCYKIAYNILLDDEESKECVNDTYLAAWESIPPAKPKILSAFLGKITRNISLKRLRAETAQKRGGGNTDLIFDELNDCIPDKNSVLDAVDANELALLIDSFLRNLPKEERILFLRRYWYFDSIDTLSKTFGLGLAQVKMRLSRIRKKLLLKLEKEGHL
jgi:RNA polymerase sigma-70 factor (ECF subfamily)